MAIRMRRALLWHDTPYQPSPRVLAGGRVALSAGPAGFVGPVPGSDNKSFNGMDPSDPATWVRPYVPMAGMVARLNFDGAAPQVTQTGPNPRRRRRARRPRAVR